MTAVLTRTNLYSTVRSNILSILDNRSYVGDPRDPNNLKIRKFVYTHDPFEIAFDFALLPYVILKWPSVVFTEPSGDWKHRSISYIHKILIRSAKDGSGGSRPDIGGFDAEKITQDIIETFNTETIKQTLRDFQMFQLKCNVLQTDEVLVGEATVYETELELSYWVRLVVSA